MPALLQRGSWLGDGHDETYGAYLKLREIAWWSGSAEMVRLLRGQASTSLDVYQWGVYTGGTMRSIAKRVPGFGRLWGFDSFSGLPAETRGVKLEGKHWREGAFSSADALGLYDQRELLRRIRAKVEYENTTLIPGFYNESLTSALARAPASAHARGSSRRSTDAAGPSSQARQHAFQPALLVDVDVDLHSSTVQCLGWMLAQRLLVPGTYLRYDDWRGEWQTYGEAQAHHELTRRHNLTWINLGSTREWRLVHVGSYDGLPEPPVARLKLRCPIVRGELCQLEDGHARWRACGPLCRSSILREPERPLSGGLAQEI